MARSPELGGALAGVVEFDAQMLSGEDRKVYGVLGISPVSLGTMRRTIASSGIGESSPDFIKFAGVHVL